MNFVKDGNYYVVQSFMITELKLKGLERDIYAIIYGFSQNGHSFSGSLSYLEEWTCSTKKGVWGCLQGMIKKGLISKEENEFNGIKTCKYAALYDNTDRGTKYTGMELSTPECGTEYTGGGVLSTPNNIVNNINNNTPPISPKGDEAVETNETSEDKPLLFADPPKFKNEPFTDGFDEFWSVYPRHQSKTPAIKAWNKLRPNPELQEIIIAAVEKAKPSFDWTKNNGSFIPYAATYLNQCRWEDEEPQTGDELKFLN